MTAAAGWDIVSGPDDAEHTVLLLPGGWCTAVFYEELMAEPDLARIRLVAITLPGNGGTAAPQDDENYARMTAELAADLSCDVVVGHSIGANVALEMAGSGAFSGPVVLLAPAFSRQDEAMIIRVLDRLAGVLGHLPFAAMRKLLRFAVKGSPLPPERLAVLVSELRERPRVHAPRNPPLPALPRPYGSVAARLCASAVPAWVVHGESGDGGMTGEERRTLQAYPWIRIVTIPGSSFFTANEEPALVAGLILQALQAIDAATT